MKKIFIQANCQSYAIRDIFSKTKRLKDRYDIIPIQPIHLWKKDEKDEIISKLKLADIFLHQPIFEKNFGFYASDNLKQYLKRDAISISFPNLYFTGYHPQAMYLKHNNQKIDGPFVYHDKNIIEAYKNNLTIKEAVKFYNDSNYFTKEEIDNMVATSIEELKGREAYTDIKMSQTIQELMQHNKLFFIFNHPTNKLIFIMVNKILEILNEPQLSEDEKEMFSQEFLSLVKFPIYKSIQDYFNIDEKLVLEYRKKEYTIYEMIKEYYKFYGTLPYLNSNLLVKKKKNFFNFSIFFKKDNNHKQRSIILHSHIFKNAGTTFDGILENNFQNNFIDHRDDNDLVQGKEEYLKLFLEQNTNIEAFSSHSTHFHPKDDEKFRFFQIYFLRHPVERILSVYNFEKKQDENASLGAKMAKQFDFDEYVLWRMQENIPATIRNTHTIFLSGMGPDANNMDEKFKRAKKYILNSNLIGVVDEFDKSLQMFENHLKGYFPNINLIDYKSKNVLDNNSFDIKLNKVLSKLDSKTLEVFLEKNRYDIELYYLAKNKVARWEINVDN